MTPTRVLVVCPGRGSYGANELGSIAAKREVLSPARQQEFDGYLAAFEHQRAQVGLTSLKDLDQAPSFSASKHLPGPNSGPLIFAASLIDFLHLQDRDDLDIAAICGNSMGWYSALAFAEALSVNETFRLISTMSSSQEGGQMGGQIMLPLTTEDWRQDESIRQQVSTTIEQVNALGADYACGVSIDLGGYWVLFASDLALKELKRSLPEVTRNGRQYPLVLPKHSAFHSPLMRKAAAFGREHLADLAWQNPKLPLIDGHGRIYNPSCVSPEDIEHYTLTEQVLGSYSFYDSLRVGLREFGVERLVLLGPGNSLGGAIGQSLIREGWNQIHDKSSFKKRQESATPLLESLGLS